MGFPLEACRKAVYYTGNLGAEVAFNWIIAHMEEPGQWLEGVSEVQLLIVYSSSQLKFWNVQQRNFPTQGNLEVWVNFPKLILGYAERRQQS